ncbi:hypothetical protein CMK22_13955 [Candidatus Poribacteria bacterium]|nr:hypothetical protein [Candidatus Poribacteria bacterium]
MLNSLRVILLIYFFISIGCSKKSSQIVVDAVSDAQTQVQLARKAGAAETTNKDLLEAQQLLNRAGELMSSGKNREAYRFAMRAYLKAAVSEAIVTADVAENDALEAEKELAAQLDIAEKKRRELERIEAKLEELKTQFDQN